MNALAPVTPAQPLMDSFRLADFGLSIMTMCEKLHQAGFMAKPVLEIDKKHARIKLYPVIIEDKTEPIGHQMEIELLPRQLRVFQYGNTPDTRGALVPLFGGESQDYSFDNYRDIANKVVGTALSPDVVGFAPDLMMCKASVEISNAFMEEAARLCGEGKTGQVVTKSHFGKAAWTALIDLNRERDKLIEIKEGLLPLYEFLQRHNLPSLSGYRKGNKAIPDTSLDGVVKHIKDFGYCHYDTGNTQTNMRSYSTHVYFARSDFEKMLSHATYIYTQKNKDKPDLIAKFMDDANDTYVEICKHLKPTGLFKRSWIVLEATMSD